MCISSNRDDLAAKFAVTAYDIDAGIRLSKPVVITACVKLDTHILSDQRTQDLIQDLLVPAIRILSVLIRTITYHIINMSVHIHLIKNSNVFQNGFKIIPYSRQIPYGLRNKKDNKDHSREPHGKNR